jgi:hypothetical protein
VWANLKNGLGNLAVVGLDGLAVVVKNRLKRIQYRTALISGFPAQTGLSLEAEPSGTYPGLSISVVELVVPSKSDAKHRRGVRLLWPAGTVVGGLVLAFVSWLIHDSGQWWSAMLSNVAVVALLPAPGELVLTRVRASFEHIERVVDQARETAESAMKTAQETARSLEEVRENLLEHQMAEHQSELDLYRTFTDDLSRELLIRGLQHATQASVITSDGVRSPVWETSLHYRYIVSDPAILEVRLETDEGNVLSSHRWEDDVPAEEFFQSLVLAVREAGDDPGVGLNDPTESVQALSEMLVQVTRLRSQELLGHRSRLTRIIERVNGWFFTEDCIIPENNLHYEIRVDRLNEMDWETHLHNKGWYGATSALEFARRLYGIDGS